MWLVAPGQLANEPTASAASVSVPPVALDAKWTGFNMGTFTVPHPPASAGDQQQPQTTGATPAQATSTSTDKKTKSGKKSKAASMQPQQVYTPNTDASGKLSSALSLVFEIHFEIPYS